VVPEICVEADRQTDRHTHAHHNTPLPTADGVEYRAGMVEAGGEVEMDVCVCVCVRERERERERDLSVCKDECKDSTDRASEKATNVTGV